MTIERTITLTFTPQKLDYIAQVLAQRPYSEVAALVADIQQQIAAQQQDQVPMKGNGQDKPPKPAPEMRQ